MGAVNTLTRIVGTIRVIDEAVDWPSMSTIVGSQAARSMWADAAATTIQLGGGAANTTVLIRAAAAGTINVGENTVAQAVNVGSASGASATAVRSGSGGLTVTATGSTLGLAATGTNPITQTTNGLARSSVTGEGAQQWIGIATVSSPSVSAADEVKFFYDKTLQEVQFSKNTSAWATFGGQATITQINGNAGAITQGQVVYHTTAAGTVDLATAAADAPAARAFGVVVDASVAAAATGAIAIVGQQRILLFETGLTGTLANGNEVYLSATTPGSVTNVAPSATGQVIQTLGVIDGPVTGYPGSLLVNVIFTLGPKALA